MGLLEDSVKGVAIGAGAVVGLGLVSPVGRPLAKRLVHGYLSLRDKLQEAGAETKEQLSDLVAEVKAERTRGTVSPRASAAAEGDGKVARKAPRRKATARSTTPRKR
jgi:hypothetical protein